jgi:hypothetical protein
MEAIFSSELHSTTTQKMFLFTSAILLLFPAVFTPTDYVLQTFIAATINCLRNAGVCVK